jgi:N-acetylneuraminic acid mutarotase
MIDPRIMGQSVRLPDGRVLVVGGINLEDTLFDAHIRKMSSSSAEIYDPTSNNWTVAADLSQGRYAFTLALLPDGQVLAIGGARDRDCCWTENSFVREIEAYDPLSNRWRIVGELPQPRAYSTATLFPDGRVWVTGGQDGSGGDISGADTWFISSLPAMP